MLGFPLGQLRTGFVADAHIEGQQLCFATICRNQAAGFRCSFGVRLVVDDDRIAQFSCEGDAYRPADAPRPASHQCISSAVSCSITYTWSFIAARKGDSTISSLKIGTVTRMWVSILL